MTTSKRLSVEGVDDMSSLELNHLYSTFLNQESHLLDHWDLREWLDLLTNDVRYRAPVRITRERGKSNFSETAAHWDESRESLEARIKQFESDFAWHENPPARVRHFVSNEYVLETDSNEAEARSNVLLHYSKRDQTTFHTLSGERHDTLREVDGRLKLAKREILLDQTTLDIPYLTTFL